MAQEALAEAAGLERTYVSFLERGLRQPTLPTVCRPARALGVTAAVLVGEYEQACAESGPPHTK
ncbi:MAG: helix-turn-helix transcriptional regulator [Burkholderiales bacterium]|nr:helix-turn-helix transcriptional regulator [Burkholderiales bacterium]